MTYKGYSKNRMTFFQTSILLVGCWQVGQGASRREHNELGERPGQGQRRQGQG